MVDIRLRRLAQHLDAPEELFRLARIQEPEIAHTHRLASGIGGMKSEGKELFNRDRGR